MAADCDSRRMRPNSLGSGLVTGGTNGIGEAIVRRSRGGGAKVATTARSGLPAGQAPDLFVQADMSTRRCRRGRPQGARRFDGVDLLVHNVGGSSAPGGGFAVLDDDEWRKAID